MSIFLCTAQDKWHTLNVLRFVEAFNLLVRAAQASGVHNYAPQSRPEVGSGGVRYSGACALLHVLYIVCIMRVRECVCVRLCA